MTDHQEALTRLTAWKAQGAIPSHITDAGGRSQFCADVSALLDLVTWRPISEAPKDGDVIEVFLASRIWLSRWSGQYADGCWYAVGVGHLNGKMKPEFWRRPSPAPAPEAAP